MYNIFLYPQYIFISGNRYPSINGASNDTRSHIRQLFTYPLCIKHHNSRPSVKSCLIEGTSLIVLAAEVLYHFSFVLTYNRKFNSSFVCIEP